MRCIHGQSGREDMEPHAVDDLGHVAGPISLVHRSYLLLRHELSVNASFQVVLWVEQAPWDVVQRAIQLSWKDLVPYLVLRVESFLTWRLRSNYFLGYKWLQDRRSPSSALLFHYTIEINYLIVVL